MLKKIYEGKYEALVAWDMTRISRNEVDSGAVQWSVRKGKLKSIHTKDSVYGESELFSASIFMSL